MVNPNPKTVLITGCSEGGIGSALALEFHSRGHTVFATRRSASKMAHLRAAGLQHTLEMDVTSEASIVAAVASAKAVTGNKLDVLVNNAGVHNVMPFADATVADFRRVLETNVLGVVAVTHAFLPLLLNARGLVAMVGSVVAILCPPFQTAYNASKAPVSALSDTLRVELQPLGVRVINVVTGSVSTNLFSNCDANAHEGGKVPEGSLYGPIRDKIEKKAFLDADRWTTPEEYARQVVNDVLKDKQPPAVYRGSFAFIARMMNTFLWKGAWNLVGLNTLRPPPQLKDTEETRTDQGW